MRPIAPPLAVLCAALTISGCIIPFNGPGDIRRDIQSATGQEYDSTFALTVGRSGMALARWAVRRSSEEPPIPLEGIRKVEIGMYEAEDPPDRLPAEPGVTASLFPSYSPMVEVGENDGENVLVLSEPRRDGSIRRLLIVVDEGEELVIVRLTGDLDAFLEQAIAFAFEQAERPDLTDPVLEEYHRGEGIENDRETAGASTLTPLPSGPTESR